MARRKIKAGSASQTVPLFVQDTSSTTGAGLGALVFNTAGLGAKYRREGQSTWTTIPLVTAAVGTWSSGGFVADGGPVTGGYELGVPDAALAAGAKWVQVEVYGAANMLPVLVEIELDAVDYQDAAAFGLSRLDQTVGSRMATFGLPANFASLAISAAGIVRAFNDAGVALASHADIVAINQSASKHIILTTVGQYERPESGTVVYTVEARTFVAADGSAVNADTTPALTTTGSISGSLAANLSAATNPATGVYRWTYTVGSADAVEQVRFDVSATIATATFTLSAYTQVADFVAATFTTTDRSNLTAVKAQTDKLTFTVTNVLDANVTAWAGSTSVVAIGAGSGLAALPMVASDLRSIRAGVLISTKVPATIAAGDIANDAITDATIAVPAEAAGRPSRVLAMVRRVFESSSWGNKRSRDRASGVANLRNAADNANLVTAVQSTAGSTVDNQTQGV